MWVKYLSENLYLIGYRDKALSWAWNSYELLSANSGSLDYDENLGTVLYTLGLYYKVTHSMFILGL